MTTPVTIATPVPGFQVHSLQGEVVLLHAARNLIIYSNQTAALVWQLCDGQRTVTEIIEILSAAYPEAQAQILTDVPQTIQTLMAQGVLEPG